ncbi:MAG: DNA mismatch repair protein MutS [Nonlabens sp.]|nr:DNA mismatch repair protein MutS [Nonlabens sp.]MDP5101628.1 DNA mismatch repair protein MutS [Nonlabens sp.]
MKKIASKTLEDLEFVTVLKQVAARCVTDNGKAAVLDVTPSVRRETVKRWLQETHEYLYSFSTEHSIPNHGFDAIEKDLQLLGIENSTLDKDSVRRLAGVVRSVNEHIRFFKKVQGVFPTLYYRTEQVPDNSYIPQAVDAIIDKFGEIKDDASVDLKNIRRGIAEIRGQLNGSFGAALSHYSQLDYLDDIRETVVDNRRVLAVKAMYRRKVKGRILGSSKTGSIAYIEPERVLMLSRKLDELELEEREEIMRILKLLTDSLRPFLEHFKECREYLTGTDVIAAKAKYARSMDAVLPLLVDHFEVELVNAFHPLLFLTNKERKEKTYPQSIQLSTEQRIIVISGPNAGGKSITLKTVGLLQVMIQSGMLIPVHEKSRVCIFEHILTDIGDNQSIDNHLSTYSYRLKNMRKFLNKANDKTLFLIDEFGTGSDPELGGALAESMLEEMHDRKAYGIITTHYTNLKMLANETAEMVNANMLFDSRTLEPIYQLQMGEAGSSFTFEVAQKNGIPYSLINKAKKKVERGKIRFDKSIAALQKERSDLRRNNESLREKETKAQQKATKLDDTQERIQQKLTDFQELYDGYQRFVQLGKKFDALALSFQNSKQKKKLIEELMKLVITENVKRLPPPKKEKPAAKKESLKQQQVEKEVINEVAKIRVEKKLTKQTVKQTAEVVKAEKPFKLNDRVRIIDSKSIGTIDSLERGKAVVNYGVFTTTISTDQLEHVQKK